MALSLDRRASSGDGDIFVTPRTWKSFESGAMLEYIERMHEEV